MQPFLCSLWLVEHGSPTKLKDIIAKNSIGV